MNAVRVVTGRALPLGRASVDTDQIIPSRYLKRIERTGFAEGLFAEWRKDQSFVLNRPEHAGASILLAGENFGTGSSREHAVWAIQESGFRAVVAPSFADIFRNNCLKNGVVPAQTSAGDFARLLQAVRDDPALELTVDVERRVVRARGIDAPFALDNFARWRLLEGLDDVSATLRLEDAIAAYERRRPSWLPTANG